MPSVQWRSPAEVAWLRVPREALPAINLGSSVEDAAVGNHLDEPASTLSLDPGSQPPAKPRVRVPRICPMMRVNEC